MKTPLLPPWIAAVLLGPALLCGAWAETPPAAKTIEPAQRPAQREATSALNRPATPIQPAATPLPRLTNPGSRTAATQAAKPAAPPRITRQPVTTRVDEGDPLTLTVEAIGDTPLIYQWWRNGVPIPGANSDTLTLEESGTADTGSYQVTVRNAAGESTSAAAAVVVSQLDYGDAPDTPYPTRRKRDGARHAIVAGFSLGPTVDSEKDGQPNADATGDGADENGVTLPPAFIRGQTANLTVNLNTSLGGQGLLAFWIDFNRNGSWDASERFTRILAPGNNPISVAVPTDALAGPSFARFRLTREIHAALPTGTATEGEVEDYRLTIEAPPQIDFGDAPDALTSGPPLFPTLLANNGARHTIEPGFFLGARVDAEPDGQPTTSADGDDLNPSTSDDEDGILFLTPLQAGHTATIQVTASQPGLLDAWLNLDGAAPWNDLTDRLLNARPVLAGTQTLTFSIPATAVPGPSFMRFRLSHNGVSSTQGLVTGGEVEDYRVEILRPMDFGDAPDGYPFAGSFYHTLLGSDGARHQIVEGFHLGSRIDGEADGQPDNTATGDDTQPSGADDDEEGVALPAAFFRGETVQVQVTASAAGVLNAWFDFNRNFSWADPGEHPILALPIPAGVTTLNIPVPNDASLGQTFARFRFSTTERRSLNFTGDGGPGEVEDYLITLADPPPPECQLSCRGTDFWLTFPGNYAPDPLNPPRPTLRIVGAPGTSVSVVVTDGSYTQTEIIPPTGLLTWILPAHTDLGDANDLAPDNGIRDLGLHLTSTSPVGVYALNKVTYTSDGYLALPTPTLGLAYIIQSFANVQPGVPELSGSQFVVVATENDTTLQILPSAVTGAHDAGFPYTLTLQRGQTYQLRNTFGPPLDLSGTLVRADKPIAVFGSHQCANVQGPSDFFCDYLVEQLTPVHTWGTEFITQPLATRSKGDLFRILAVLNNTTLSINGAPVATLNRGQFHQTLLLTPAHITADKPVHLTQYATSSDFDGVTKADPFMVQIQHTGHYAPQQHFATGGPGFDSHHANIVAHAADAGAVLLNGAPIPAALFTPVGASGYSVATVPLLTSGPHLLTAPHPLGLTLYGWNTYESYAWPGCFFFGDSQAPTLECLPGPITLTAGSPGSNDPCLAQVPDFTGRILVSDRCQIPGAGNGLSQVTQDPPPGTLLPPGNYELLFSASDSSGNTGTCATPLTILPNPEVPVVLECPPDLFIGQCPVQAGELRGAFVEFQPVAHLGCTEIQLQCEPPSGSFFPEGQTQVIARPLNPSLDILCTFTITVRCGSLPSIQ